MNIFLSYNRRSTPLAKILVSDLEALGYSVWYDQELSGGQVWWDQILDNIRKCSLFVLIMDQKTLDSTACKREFEYAAGLGKPILPVLLSGDISPNLLPPALSKIQYVDYRKQDRDTAFNLARAITTIPPAGNLPDPLPSPPEVPVSYLGSITEKIESSNELKYEEQSVIVIDLKKYIHDPENENDARSLLKRLRKRRDLYAAIAEEIDELIKESDLKGVINQEIQNKEPLEFKSPGIDKEPEALISDKKIKPKKSNADFKKPDSNRTVLDQDRIKSVIILVSIGLLFQLLFGMILHFRGYANIWFVFGRIYYYAFPLGAAISGFIWGNNKKTQLFGTIGLLISFIVIAIFIYRPMGFALFLLCLIVVPLSTYIGIYLSNSRN